MIILRAMHDLAVKLYEERLADKDAEIRRLREDLAEAQMRERLALAEPKVVQAPRPEPVRREPTAVDTAIAIRSGGEPRLRAYLVGYARAQRASGVAEEDIADRILHGERVTDDEPVDS